jgi:hypothetical protein
VSGPNDTTPPPSGTLPTDPAPPPSVPVPVILAGHAQEAVSSALTRLVEAYVALEATAMAVARQLDATAE